MTFPTHISGDLSSFLRYLQKTNGITAMNSTCSCAFVAAYVYDLIAGHLIFCL